MGERERGDKKNTRDGVGERERIRRIREMGWERERERVMDFRRHSLHRVMA